MRLPVNLCVLLQTMPRDAHGWCPVKGCPLESTTVKHADRSSRRGLTLIEMLVSVTLTQMIVFALVSVFDLIGNSVTDSRAIIELSGNLRGAANRLQQDLAGLTVTTLPPRDPSHGEGYLEIVDGPHTDRQHYVFTTDGTSSYADLASDFVDPVGDGFVEGPVSFDTSVGDTDDVLAFTARSQGEPFIGQVSHPGVRLVDPINTNQEWSALDSNRDGIPDLATRSLESQVAEVIWWLQIDRSLAITDITMIQELPEAEQIDNAINGEVQFYPNSTNTMLGTPVRSLHRRVMLIRPDLEFTDGEGKPLLLNNLDEVASFQTNNDISVRFERRADGRYRVEANSLGDLTRRRNRFCRRSFRSTSAPWSLPQTPIDTDLLLRHATLKDMVINGRSSFMMRRGEDVVLSDVLAFDVQVYDPKAWVLLAADGSAVTPSDPGYTKAAVKPQALSVGTFVDLGYGVPPKSGNAQLLLVLHGNFAVSPHFKSKLKNRDGRMTYCTWCDEYERDGFNQNGGLVDEGTNGLDDDNTNGVDDVGELETMPPYPHPLRGITVKLRVMEFNTRQVRQTSVAVDFTPE